MAGRKESRESRGNRDPKPVTRARAEKASPIETARRVDFIVGLMQRDEWQRTASAESLAEAWGVAPATVEALAVEAGRRTIFIAKLVTDPELLKADVSKVLMRSLHSAVESGSHSDVARVGDIVTKITGARAPERKDLRVEMSELEALAPPALRARLVDQIAKLTAALAKLDDEHPENVPKERT